MSDNSKLRKVSDRIREISAQMTVGIYVDLDNIIALDFESRQLDHANLAHAMLRLAQSSGRVVEANAYYSPHHEDYVMDARPWRGCGFTPVRIDDVEDEGAASITMAMDSNATKADVCILVVGDVNYNLVARYLMRRGVICVVVGEYNRDMRVLPRDSCVYVPLHTVLDSRGSAEDFNPDSYDFAPFVDLLRDSESRIPFVGTRHFVNRVMWRLDRDEPNGSVNRQAVFQAAVDAGIVELYETDNINGSENKVSSCRLNQDHPLVKPEEAPAPKITPDISVSVTTPNGSVIKDSSGILHGTP